MPTKSPIQDSDQLLRNTDHLMTLTYIFYFVPAIFYFLFNIWYLLFLLFYLVLETFCQRPNNFIYHHLHFLFLLLQIYSLEMIKILKEKIQNIPRRNKPLYIYIYNIYIYTCRERVRERKIERERERERERETPPNKVNSLSGFKQVLNIIVFFLLDRVQYRN